MKKIVLCFLMLGLATLFVSCIDLSTTTYCEGECTCEASCSCKK